MKYQLYGDGIHDDLPAIQEMLDSGMSCVYLPPPEKNYLICGTIYIHSDQELRLDRYTRIQLGEQCNCAMLRNAEPQDWNSHIRISGGIWDMNHNAQEPNPAHFPPGKLSRDLKENGFDKMKRFFPDHVYTGFCFILNSIKHLYFGNLTIVNPVVYGADFSYIEDFTIENIDFEYTEGSPKLWNLDGIHIEAYCKNGLIRNLKGACHDDVVALTSDDLFSGPIENITVDGIYAEGAHSAVRILSNRTPVRNVHVTNIYGSYYVYGVIISDYQCEIPGCRSIFENIAIDHIYASISPGTADVEGNWSPLIHVRSEFLPVQLQSLHISHVYRMETHCPQPTIGISQNVSIKHMAVSHCLQNNETDKPIEFLRMNGQIDKLWLLDIETNDDPLLTGEGEIKEKVVD